MRVVQDGLISASRRWIAEVVLLGLHADHRSLDPAEQRLGVSGIRFKLPSLDGGQKPPKDLGCFLPRLTTRGCGPRTGFGVLGHHDIPSGVPVRRTLGSRRPREWPSWASVGCGVLR